MGAAIPGDLIDRRGELGQVLTPPAVADFMASMFGPLPETVRVLDAGAGAGSLTLAFVSRLCGQPGAVRAVDATLYEVDPAILGDLARTLRDCEARCERAAIRFSYRIEACDFVATAASRLAEGLFDAQAPRFDAAILNPPYRKIGAASPERRALRRVGIEATNLYTAFLALARRLLVPGGQVVAITPRSFCNGPYHRPFREDLLDGCALGRIHVFESRQAVFRSSGVLQESVIVHAIRGERQAAEVRISCSSGEPGGAVSERRVPFAEVVHPGDPGRFLHLPSEEGHRAAGDLIAALPSRLPDLGVAVSTGRVVEFRLRPALRGAPGPGTVPLIYPGHFHRGLVRWPRPDGRKPNAIVDDETTRPWLVPSGLYLLTRRFTAKEEARRLVACLYEPEPIGAGRVGFENHLNYFHAGGRGLDRPLAAGLFAYLNSTVVDQYFRRFSGHTQVNATDLRTLPYPDPGTLRALGGRLPAFDLDQRSIDELVGEHIHGRS
jgi:adenine-specific DNA-methyltransferase